jgi:Ca2+-binding RTX toxin-like protein
VVFGGTDLGASGSISFQDRSSSFLDGSNGFVINGIAASDRSGFSVSAAGDVNGDGIGDVIIGAPDTDANGTSSGSSYIIFGSPVSVAAPTADDDTLIGTNAGDVIRGGAGNDLLDGRNDNDWLLGNRGNDTLIGGNGDELLFGGWGRDLLTGGVGTDRFLLRQNSGTDTITDFESGIDSLVLFGGLTFEQLTITQSNNDTLLSLGSNNQVIATLTEIPANVLTSADFVTL